MRTRRLNSGRGRNETEIAGGIDRGDVSLIVQWLHSWLTFLFFAVEKIIRWRTERATMLVSSAFTLLSYASFALFLFLFLFFLFVCVFFFLRVSRTGLQLRVNHSFVYARDREKRGERIKKKTPVYRWGRVTRSSSNSSLTHRKEDRWFAGYRRLQSERAARAFVAVEEWICQRPFCAAHSWNPLMQIDLPVDKRI